MTHTQNSSLEAETGQKPVSALLAPTGDALFDSAIRQTLQNEGFVSDDPSDPGGPTVFGVSLRFARQLGDLDGDGFADLDLDFDGDVDFDDLRSLTPDAVAKLFREAFWDKYAYHRLPGVISGKVFDLAVNMGPHQAHVLLQRACRASSDERLVEDGIIGFRTITIAAGCYQPALMASLRSEAAGFYRLLARVNPTSRKFLNGWLNRAYQ